MAEIARGLEQLFNTTQDVKTTLQTLTSEIQSLPELAAQLMQIEIQVSESRGIDVLLIVVEQCVSDLKLLSRFVQDPIEEKAHVVHANALALDDFFDDVQEIVDDDELREGEEWTDEEEEELHELFR
jgi:hypothetical protein